MPLICLVYRLCCHMTRPHHAASIFHMRVKSRRRLLGSVLGSRALLTRCRLQQQEENRVHVHVARSCIPMAARILEGSGGPRQGSDGRRLALAPRSLLRLGLDMTRRIYYCTPLGHHSVATPSAHRVYIQYRRPWQSHKVASDASNTLPSLPRPRRKPDHQIQIP